MSIIGSIRNNFVPIRREGFPFIATFGILSLIAGFLWTPLFWVGLVLTIWCIYFFRDPARITPLNPELVISPADGKVSFVGQVVPPLELGLGTELQLRISVFMDVFSCHVNRMPIDGTVKSITYKLGKFANAELDKASEHNERNGIVIETMHGNIGVVQVAGLVARRIICWIKEGDKSIVGQRFGLIRFGSRLDIYMPLSVKVHVAVGQKMIAGETILAAFDNSMNIKDFRLD